LEAGSLNRWITREVLIARFFLALSNIPLSGCTSLFISLPTEGHLGFFQVLALMHKAAVNINCRFLCEDKFSTLLSK